MGHRSAMKEYKITKPVFKQFVKYVRYYANTWGLSDWELEVEIGKEKTDNRATCYSGLEDKFCKITIDPMWDVEPTDKLIKSCAFHEVLELLVAPMDVLMKERFITLPQINEARHTVIMRLQNLLLD